MHVGILSRIRNSDPNHSMPAARSMRIRTCYNPTTRDENTVPSGSRGRALVRINNLPPWLSLLCMVIYIKEEPTMQISVSSTLTVYHDGQFWVGLAKHVEGGRYGAARIVFGAEPSD